MTNKLSANRLLGLGAALILVGVLLDRVIPRGQYTSEGQAAFFQSVEGLIGILITLAYLLGVACLAAGLGTKAVVWELTRRERTKQ